MTVGPQGGVVEPDLAPPPGPGVRVPFVAPPTDGLRRRRWLMVGLAAAVAVVCCVGGGLSLGGLGLLASRSLSDQARGTVQRYLQAIEDRDYEKAYELLCPSMRGRTEERIFVPSVQGWNMVSFDVGTPKMADPVTVPATIRSGDQTSQVVTFSLEQEKSTGEFRVCGLDR